MRDKVFAVNVYGLLRNLTAAFGKETAEVALVRFVTSFIENTGDTLADCVVHTAGAETRSAAEIVMINSSQLIEELELNVSVIQMVDIIFSWQLSNYNLFFNAGKRHEQ